MKSFCQIKNGFANLFVPDMFYFQLFNLGFKSLMMAVLCSEFAMMRFLQAAAFIVSV